MKPSPGWAMGAMLLATLGCSVEPPGDAAEESVAEPVEVAEFAVHRGVNVSHWLSQSEDRGAERAARLTAADFTIIKELGFDHVRLPVDEEQLWDDPEAQSKFIDLWKQLSGELHEYPLDMVAYEPLNEAVAEDSEDWNKLINQVIGALRELEPERVIVMGSNRWQTAGTFPDLQIPANDPNIILSFHFYTPMPVTHYTAPWTPLASYMGPVVYPGQAIDEAEYEAMDETLLAAVEEHNGMFDRAALEAIMVPAIEVARAANLPLYCGEFGAFPAAPLEVRQAWYRDMISIFDEHDIAWAHWNYKDDFPLVTQDLEPITELLGILIPGDGSVVSR